MEENADDIEAAASGTRIHEYLHLTNSQLPSEAFTLPVISEDEEMVVRCCQRKRNDLLAAWDAHNPPDSSPVRYLEDRLFLARGLKVVFSGQPDEVDVCGKRALVMDYKTGWQADVVTRSGQNPQLRALALLVADAYDVDEVEVAIITGRDGGPVERAQYDAAALQSAKEELFQILDEAALDDAPVNPGNKQCRYCRAVLSCPAAMQEIKAMSVMSMGNTDEERRELVDNNTLAALLDKCGAVERMVGAVRAEAKRRIANGETVPGWCLSEPSSRRSVTDAAKAFNALSDALPALTAEMFAACCTVKVSELDKAVRKAGQMKAADAKVFINTLLTEAQCFETKPGAPSLERVAQP